MKQERPPYDPEPSGLRTTIVLAVLVLGLFAFVKLGDLAGRQETELKESRVFPFLEAADVVRVTLTPRDKPEVVLVRHTIAPATPPAGEGEEEASGRRKEEETFWRLEKPIEDDAEGGEVVRVLNALEWLEFTKGGKLEGDKAKEVKFGDVVAKVVIGRKDGKPAIEFELGAEDLGTRPLRVSSEPGVVYLVKSPKLAEDLAQDAWKFRKKQLLDLQRDLVERMALRVAPAQAGPGVAAREVELLEVDGYWRVGGKDGEFAEDSLVQTLMGDAYGLRALDAVAEAPAEAELAKLGLAPPLVRIEVEVPARDGREAKKQWVELGTPVDGKPDRRHARANGRSIVFTVDASSLKEELERPAEGWRTDDLVVMRGGASSVTGFAVTFDDGTTWGVTQQNKTWMFDAPDAKKDAPPVLASTVPVESLVGDVLGLTILERVPPPHDRKALGLDPPAIKLAVVQEPLRRELHIGAPKPGAPGVHHVVRVGEDRVFTARIDALPGRLRDAPLELLDRGIFNASEWEAKKVVLSDADGKVLFEAAGAGEVREWKVTTPPSPDAESDRVRELVARFKEVKVERWVARDDPEARKQAGLDRPMRLAVTVEKFVEGKPKDVEQVLLLGRREGERIHALAEGGTAIGRIDATFLDVIERGFAKGTTILESDRWDARGLEWKQGDTVMLSVKKPAEVWLRADGGAEQVVETTDVEDLLKIFERVDVSRAEPRADERLKAVGLAPSPRETVTITLRGKDGGKDETRTLLVGDREGPREVWATAEGAASMGLLFDEPLRALREWREAHPLPAQFPPVDDDAPPAPQDGGQGAVPPADGQQGAAPPADGQQGAAPPADGQQGAAPPGDGQQQGAAPPADGQQGAAPPADGQQGAAPAPTPPADGQQGAAAAAASKKVACEVCGAAVPGGGPFTFRDPRPPHPVYEVCSAGELDKLKQMLAVGVEIDDGDR